MDTSWDTDSKLPLPTSLIKIEQSDAVKVEKSLTPIKSSPSGELDKSLFKFKGRIPRSHPSVKWVKIIVAFQIKSPKADQVFFPFRVISVNIRSGR